MTKSYLILILFAMAASAFAQGAVRMVDADEPAKQTISDTISFVLTPHNNMIIQAILNEKDTVDLMFHTAASSMTLIKSATAKLTSVNFNHQDTVNSWGGDNFSRYSAGNILQIGRFRWEKVSIWENENSGPLSDGKFGPDLFRGKAIEINFDENRIVIHPSLPAAGEGYEKLDLVFENDLMFIEGVSNIGEKAYKNRFLIHSGYAGTILFNDEFAEKNKLGESLTIIDEKELKDSYGNVLKTQKAILPAFSIGRAVLRDMPVGFFSGSIGRQKMSVIGGDLLKRFNMVIDAKREYLYLRPNGWMQKPYANI